MFKYILKFTFIVMIVQDYKRGYLHEPVIENSTILLKLD